MDRWWPRVVVVVAVLCIHAAVLMDVFGPQSGKSAPRREADVFATAEIIGADRGLDKVPAPDLQLESVPVELGGLHEIDFDDSVQEELAQVTGPASAPHLARVQSVDSAVFARRAQLPPGSALTILLRIEVRENGSVGSADIVRTSGNAAADAAAIAYALELRWVPGTMGRSPKTMRVNLPVTLVSTPVAPAPDPSKYLCVAQARGYINRRPPVGAPNWMHCG